MPRHKQKLHGINKTFYGTKKSSQGRNKNCNGGGQASNRVVGSGSYGGNDATFIERKAYHSNLYEEDEEYVLLLDNCKGAIFLPGPAREFFSLERYQEEVGRDFKRITPYLCTAQDFYRSENVNLDRSDASDNDNNNSVITAEKSAPAKHLEEDPDSFSNEDCKKLSVNEERGVQIQYDEEIAMELQKQFVDEVVCPDQVTTQIGETGHVNLELESCEKSHYADKDDEGEPGEKKRPLLLSMKLFRLWRRELTEKRVLHHCEAENAITANYTSVALRVEEARGAS